MTKEQEDILLKEGRMLPVMEHFYTIQGEGFHAGKAAYFIRLGGCDVGCHWCDVKESWDPTLHPLMSTEEIAETAAKYCKTIVLTGGEPLMWNLEILTSKLKELVATNFGLTKISAMTSDENLSSQKLIERLGLKFQKYVIFPDDNEELRYYEN